MQIALGNVITAWMKSGEGSVFVSVDRQALIGISQRNFVNSCDDLIIFLDKIVAKVCPVVALSESELTALLLRKSQAWRYVLNEFRVKRNRLGANCAKEFSVR